MLQVGWQPGIQTLRQRLNIKAPRSRSCSEVAGMAAEPSRGRSYAAVKSYPFSESFPSALKIQTRALCNSMSHESLLAMKLITVFPSVRLWFGTRCHSSHLHQHQAGYPKPSSLLPPHTLPLGRPSAPAPSIQYRASNLDWRFVSYMILYMFQCHSPKSSHPLPLPQSP